MKKFTIKQFMAGDHHETFIKKAQKHIKKNKSFYITVSGMTIFFLFTGMDGSSMAASTGIDTGMGRMYKKVVSVGKWILIIKGGIDTIGAVTTGDFESAKKKAIGYVLSFLILLGLPWIFGEAEKLFDDLETSGKK